MHEALVEGIVVGDDELMERYLDGDVPSVEELEKTLAAGVAVGPVFPVMCGSAAKDIAVDRLADVHLRDRPVAPTGRPVDRHAGDQRRGDRGPTRRPAAGLGLQDPGRPVRRQDLAVQGAVGDASAPTPSSTNSRTHADEKLHGLFTLRGKEQVRVNEVAGRRHRRGGQAGRRRAPATPWRPKGTPVVVPTARGRRPVLSIAIRPEVQGRRGQADDRPAPAAGGGPGARACAGTTRPTRPCCPGMGETHLAIVTRAAAAQVRRRGRDRGGAWSPTGRRSPSAAEAEGKYKKQTGGHGQFGVAILRVEPLERGAGFEFVDADRRRRHPPPVHPRGARRASRRRWARAACSATRWST